MIISFDPTLAKTLRLPTERLRLLLLVLIAITIIGGWLFALFVLGVLLIGGWEYTTLLKRNQHGPSQLLTMALIALPVGATWFEHPDWLAPGLIALLIAGIGSMIWRMEQQRPQPGIDLALAIVDDRGFISDDAFEAAKSKLSEEEILEIVAVTIFNLYTNYINHVVETTVDFPEVQATASAGA